MKETINILILHIELHIVNEMDLHFSIQESRQTTMMEKLSKNLKSADRLKLAGRLATKQTTKWEVMRNKNCAQSMCKCAIVAVSNKPRKIKQFDGTVKKRKHLNSRCEKERARRETFLFSSTSFPSSIFHLFTFFFCLFRFSIIEWSQLH